MENIKKNQLFLTDPILILKSYAEQVSDYLYSTDDGIVFLSLGLGSLINHSADKKHENAYWIVDLKSQVIHFYSLRAIKSGEEILHDYRYELEYLKGWKH